MVVDAAVKVVGKNSGADVDSSLYNEFLDKQVINSDTGSD